MKNHAALLALCGLSLAGSAAPAAEPAVSGRERLNLDDGWRFALGHATDRSRDFGHATGYFSYLAKTGFGDGPASPAFDDRAWRRVNLPHDWAVEAPFDPKASPSHGFKAVGPGFPERSVGWYRRRFFVAEADLGRRISIELEGVQRDARVFVNGFFVGHEPSGTLGQRYDVSDYLDYGGDNLIAVRVDVSLEEGWYYEGAGIYRHVWLSKTDPLHVAADGVWVRTEVGEGRATLSVRTDVRNDGREPANVRLLHTLVDRSGTSVASSSGSSSSLAPGGSSEIDDTLSLPEPTLWSLENPYLYTLETTLKNAAGSILDRTTTTVGIRTIRFDPDAGFFLNGKPVKLKGTNNHQDHAGVGIAIPDALQEWRLRRLQEMGVNAYRASHHPASPALLDACDRLGMLVIDETRLMGTSAFHLDAVARMIRRDRNHPSVFLWSLGNEEWAIEGNVRGARIARTMQDFARRLDPTRLTTVGISGGWGGISTVVDVMGVNYIRHGSTDAQHAAFPRQVILGTEETTTQATRGIYLEDRTRAHLAPLEQGSSGGNAETGWQHYASRAYLAGVFFWTGFDYRGEPTPFDYPAISSQFGILDACGFPKDSFYYLKSWWTDAPVLHLSPHWNWQGREGQQIDVRAHGNCEEVELFQDGRSLGRRAMPRNGHVAWQVPYAPGELLARGFRAGRADLETRVATTGRAAAVELVPDRAQLAADGRDLAVVTVRISDAADRTVPTADNLVRFELAGPGRILGVGNGDPSSHEPDVFVETVSSQPLGAFTVPDPADGETEVAFEAFFDRPQVPPHTRVSLLVNTLGRTQTATLNGELLYANAAPRASRTEIAIVADALRPTGNVLRLVAKPHSERRERESLWQLAPAALRFETAPDPWQRSAFNGLAQVIVQATGEPGTIRLRGVSDGLESDTIELSVR